MSIKLKGSSDGSVSLQAPADTSPTGTDKTFTLPAQDGDAGQVLKTDGSGALSFTDNLASGRNLVINGDMRVAQRATSVTGVANSANEGYQSLDRFGLYWANAAGGVCTASQSSDVPANEGFSNSFKVDVTTADTTVNTNHMVYMSTILEAQDIRNSGWNYTDPSSYLTLSFWAKSSKAGIYCINLRNYDAGSYNYVFEYTLAANTWTKVTHKIPGHASLVINNDIGHGIDVKWMFVAGTDRDNHTGNSWLNDGTAAATSNQVNFFDSTSNDFYLTGVQLEVGEVATPFERRSYADELRRCQRYRYQLDLGTNSHVGHIVMSRFSAGQGPAYAGLQVPVEMRGTPNFTFTGTTLGSTGYAGNPNLNRATKSLFVLTSTNNVAANGVLFLRPSNTSGSVLILNLTSEL